jgi:2-phosphosulfolactate phosphatase
MEAARGCTGPRRFPDGSALSLASPARTTFTACLRNCEAVAEEVAARGGTVAVIPAGEQWSDGSLRPCVEDLAGAGAVLSRLPGRRSPEAETAVAVFERFRHDLVAMLAGSISGKELIERGFAFDLAIAADYSSSRSVPLLVRDGFVNVARAPA